MARWAWRTPLRFIGGLAGDGIHPNAAGHRVMADEVVRVLRANGVPPQQES